eukprot:7515430-Alexandrium_andersonii.AAC.1
MNSMRGSVGMVMLAMTFPDGSKSIGCKLDPVGNLQGGVACGCGIASNMFVGAGDREAGRSAPECVLEHWC